MSAGASAMARDAPLMRCSVAGIFLSSAPASGPVGLAVASAISRANATAVRFRRVSSSNTLCTARARDCLVELLLADAVAVRADRRPLRGVRPARILVVADSRFDLDPADPERASADATLEQAREHCSLNGLLDILVTAKARLVKAATAETQDQPPGSGSAPHTR